MKENTEEKRERKGGRKGGRKKIREESMGKGFEAYVSHYLYQLAKCYWDGNFLKAFFSY